MRERFVSQRRRRFVRPCAQPQCLDHGRRRSRARRARCPNHTRPRQTALTGGLRPGLPTCSTGSPTCRRPVCTTFMRCTQISPSVSMWVRSSKRRGHGRTVCIRPERQPGEVRSTDREVHPGGRHAGSVFGLNGPAHTRDNRAAARAARYVFRTQIVALRRVRPRRRSCPFRELQAAPAVAACRCVIHFAPIGIFIPALSPLVRDTGGEGRRAAETV